MGEPPTKPARCRAPSNFRQQDVARTIAAAQGRGLDIMRVEVDPKTAKIVLVVKNDDEATMPVLPSDKQQQRATPVDNNLLGCKAKLRAPSDVDRHGA